jgi:hypothetical protein
MDSKQLIENTTKNLNDVLALGNTTPDQAIAISGVFMQMALVQVLEEMLTHLEGLASHASSR